MTKTHRRITYQQKKFEELVGPDPEVVRELRSQAAKKAWDRRLGRDFESKMLRREKRLDEFEAILNQIERDAKGSIVP